MPSTNTITSFNSFSALTVIKSALVNANFSIYRGHLIPVDPTASSSPDLTYDLGGDTHSWRGIYGQYQIMYQNTAGSIPASPTATAMALYFKTDGLLYKKSPAGTETAIFDLTSTLPISKGGTGQTTAAPAFNALSPMSADGDIIYGTASGAASRLPKGSDGLALFLVSGRPAWATITANLATQVTGTAAIANGGTGQVTAVAAFNALQPMSTAGDIIYGTASGAASRLPIGVTGTVLTVGISGLPGWTTASGLNSYLSFTSALKTPTGNNAPIFSGNNVVLAPGEWELHGGIIGSASGGSPVFNAYALYWAGSNGTDTTTSNPATVASIGVTVQAGFDNIIYNNGTFGNDYGGGSTTWMRVSVATTATLYLVAYTQQSIASFARVQVYGYARRIS